MASWLNHPRYARARDELISYLRSEKYRFRRLAPVLFLCGGKDSPNRETLRKYLKRRRPELEIFYAERVWEQIASFSDQGALKVEADLAALADLVIIIVESPGTFAELGAFSISDPLRKKLLPIVDEQYEHEKSFISTGPLAWIDGESHFKPTIYAPLPKILESIDKIEERINRMSKPKAVGISDLASSPKHLLFFLADLIAVIQPASFEMIEFYITRIAPSITSSQTRIRTLVGLGIAMQILSATLVTIEGEAQEFFSTATSYAPERPFHHRRMLDLPSQRAALVSVLQTLPEATAALAALGGV